MKKNNFTVISENQKSDFFYEKRKSNLNITFNRVSFIFFIFFIISTIFSIHLIHLGSRNDTKIIKSNLHNSTQKLYRADVVDRNGNYLVKTVNSIDIGISTKKIINKEKLILNLKYIFPNKDYDLVEEKMEKKNFFYFEKKISQENYDKIMKLGDKSIQSEDRLVRVYPEKNLFSHIIGQIDDNNNGISGIEKSFDDKLKVSTKPITLSLDKDIQYLIRNELIKFNEIFTTKGSSAILMNVNNGEIFSLVSLPDFNPNKRSL